MAESNVSMYQTLPHKQRHDQSAKRCYRRNNTPKSSSRALINHLITRNNMRKGVLLRVKD